MVDSKVQALFEKTKNKKLIHPKSVDFFKIILNAAMAQGSFRLVRNLRVFMALTFRQQTLPFGDDLEFWK